MNYRLLEQAEFFAPRLVVLATSRSLDDLEFEIEIGRVTGIVEAAQTEFPEEAVRLGKMLSGNIRDARRVRSYYSNPANIIEDGDDDEELLAGKPDLDADGNPMYYPDDDAFVVPVKAADHRLEDW